MCFESGGSRAVAPALSSSLATTMAHGLYGSGCLHGSQRPWPMACTTGSRAGLRAEKEEDDAENWELKNYENQRRNLKKIERYEKVYGKDHADKLRSRVSISKSL